VDPASSLGAPGGPHGPSAPPTASLSPERQSGGPLEPSALSVSRKPEQQHALTIVTPIREGRLEALRAVLNPIGEDVLNKSGQTHGIRFQDLRTVHFMRWVILEPDLHGRALAPQLILETNFDGALDRHLDELIQVTGSALFQIYSHCTDFPEAPSPEATKRYLQRYQVPSSAFYIGTRGLSVGQILKDHALREGIEEFLDSRQRTPGWKDRPQQDIRREIVAFVDGDPRFQWAVRRPPDEPGLSEWLRKAVLWTSAIAIASGVIAGPPAIAFAMNWGFWLPPGAWGAVLIVTALLLLAVLVRREMKDKQEPGVENPENASRIARLEDHQIQNQMTDVVFIKPGWFRFLVLKSVLFVINFAAKTIFTHGAKTIFTHGTLGGIPSIHFARWFIIDQGRRLVFHSNFDGSWENYLDDFIDKAANGLTAVWSNAVGFPRSRMLIGAGARDERRFKAYVRNTQVFTNVWYSAYPRLTVQNIQRNARIRSMLARTLGPSETQEWLRLL
jgi:hypothetical protein